MKSGLYSEKSFSKISFQVLKDLYFVEIIMYGSMDFFLLLYEAHLWYYIDVKHFPFSMV
jgi:hypothetical protein